MKKKIDVVGAIIENEKGEILATLRSFEMALSNYWEFPGGKVEEGETFKETIEREIVEELDCKVEAEFNPYETTIHEYEKFIIELTTVKCKITEGSPKVIEHEKMIWLSKAYLGSLIWAPADIPAVEKLIKES